jgi:hypothetical protein
MYCIQVVSSLRGCQGRRLAASGTVKCGGAGGVRFAGGGVAARQLELRWRPGSGVGDDGVDQAWWSRQTAAARGAATLCFGRGVVGHRPQWRSMGAYQWGSNNIDGGASVTATANFGSLAVYYAKSSTF